MVWAGKEVRSRTDYILGTDRRIFWNVSVRDPMHNSDQSLVLGCLLSPPLREHSDYLGRHKRLSIRPTTTPTRKNGIFAALRRSAPKPKAWNAQKNAWISEAMWRLVDERVSARWDPARYQYLIRRLGRAIVASLKVDRRQRAEEASEEVEKLLGTDPPLHWEAWHRMKG